MARGFCDGVISSYLSSASSFLCDGFLLLPWCRVASSNTYIVSWRPKRMCGECGDMHKPHERSSAGPGSVERVVSIEYLIECAFYMCLEHVREPSWQLDDVHDGYERKEECIGNEVVDEK
jgi:hypothetical protein